MNALSRHPACSKTAIIVALTFLPLPAVAAPDDGGNALYDALTLSTHTTRVVVVNTALLGTAAGMIGAFAYLRKRSLMGDALSHATLPGVAGAFLLTGSKGLPALTAGAAFTGVLGVLSVIGIRRFSRVHEDAAIGIVLSVFFGFGLVLLSVVQATQIGDSAGLATFIYGKPAALTEADARLIKYAVLLGIAGALLLYKEFKVICFDPEFAAAQGWPVTFIDVIMMALVVLVTVIGLQAVGLILIVALLIVPPAAARFWTDRLGVMLWLSALFGAASGYIGAVLSAAVPKLPTGAVIVMVSGQFFAASLLLAPRRGLVASFGRRFALRRRVALQHLLRTLAEYEEWRGEAASADIEELFHRRSWSRGSFHRVLRRAESQALVTRLPGDRVMLTPEGRVDARRVLRNHRLWEVYLIRHADIAPSHVDRDADEIEHVLPPDLIAELERALARQEAPIPPSPHREAWST